MTLLENMTQGFYMAMSFVTFMLTIASGVVIIAVIGSLINDWMERR